MGHPGGRADLQGAGTWGITVMITHLPEEQAHDGRTQGTN